MHRLSVDHAINYTAEDVVLFRESPFASWMERLTLENPNHGIAPDPGGEAPGELTKQQDEISDIFATGGRGVESVAWQDFVLIEKPPGVSRGQRPDKFRRNLDFEGSDIVFLEDRMSELERRAATLEAMRRGADFIVKGQLAVEPLSASVNLLMRSGGTSELGNYLYIPCDTQPQNSLYSAFILCHAADLLQVLQGKLPPQLLILGDDVDILSLETQSHIYHYRAVKRRFLAAQSAFRKHRMPDPADSAHFGRWSDCANAVLKQRAMATASQEARPAADSKKKPGRKPVPVSAEVSSPRLGQSPVNIEVPSPKMAGDKVSPNKQPLIDLDTPNSSGARLLAMPRVATLPLSPGCVDRDDTFDEPAILAFDSTLKTSEGLDW